MSVVSTGCLTIDNQWGCCTLLRHAVADKHGSTLKVLLYGHYDLWSEAPAPAGCALRRLSFMQCKGAGTVP